MDEQVERYGHVYDTHGNCGMVLRPEGEWVFYTDYAALLAERDQLKRDCDLLATILCKRGKEIDTLAAKYDRLVDKVVARFEDSFRVSEGLLPINLDWKYHDGCPLFPDRPAALKALEEQ